jgi:prevent-host-death family protein
MEETITAAEANRSFSRLLRGAQEGHRYIVTSHGKPVAQVVPVPPSDRGKAAAKKALLERLAQQPEVQVGRWTRDELYEDGP